MSARRRWSLGLQWGACAWLGLIALWAVNGELAWLLRESAGYDLPRWVYGGCLHPWYTTAAWLSALALIGAGSRWSRVAVASAIVLQVVVGVSAGTSDAEPSSVAFVLRFFLPMCVPLLPLVVLEVKEPRIVGALFVVGRFREARARFGGPGVLAVAIATLSVNHGVLDLLSYGFGPRAMLWRIREYGLPWTGYMLPVVLFAHAAMVVSSASREPTTTG